MTICKFCKEDRTPNILHEICTNEDLRQINHVDENKGLHCMGINCGKFEQIEVNNEDVK